MATLDLSSEDAAEDQGNQEDHLSFSEVFLNGGYSSAKALRGYRRASMESGSYELVEALGEESGFPIYSYILRLVLEPEEPLSLKVFLPWHPQVCEKNWVSAPNQGVSATTVEDETVSISRPHNHPIGRGGYWYRLDKETVCKVYGRALWCSQI